MFRLDPFQIAHRHRLNEEVLEPRLRRVGADPRELAVEPGADVSEHDVVLSASARPALAEGARLTHEHCAVAGSSLPWESVSPVQNPPHRLPVQAAFRAALHSPPLRFGVEPDPLRPGEYPLER